MKKLLCVISAIVLMTSLCACSKDDDSTSVKIPDTTSSKVSMTYEEAIKPFQSDENYESFYDRAETILLHLKCVNAYYNDISWAHEIEPSGEISNENGITDSMNALEEYFKSEQQYTDYANSLSNPVAKDSYLKFIDLAKEAYQTFADNPTESVTEQVNLITTTTLEQYFSNLPTPSALSSASDYLTEYTNSVKYNLWFIEAYCELTPDEIVKIMLSNQETAYEERMITVTGQCSSIDFAGSAEGIDLDYIITTLDSLMVLKDNAYAIAVEAYGSDSQKLTAYNEFIEQATKLYNTVRVNRPEFNDAEYIEKYDFDLDVLEGYNDLFV